MENVAQEIEKSIPGAIGMKRAMSCLVRAVPVVAALLLTSCLLYSSFPLSDENNCHDPQLEGGWITEKQDPAGVVRTETVEIRDAGKVYTCVMETVEVCNTGKVPSRKTEKKNTSFILTKLETHVFVSVLTNDGTYQIFRIQVGGNELKVFGLSQDGVKLAEKEILHQTKDGRIQMKVTQEKLQSWCVRNAADFSALICAYRKRVAPSH